MNQLTIVMLLRWIFLHPSTPHAAPAPAPATAVAGIEVSIPAISAATTALPEDLDEEAEGDRVLCEALIQAEVPDVYDPHEGETYRHAGDVKQRVQTAGLYKRFTKTKLFIRFHHHRMKAKKTKAVVDQDVAYCSRVLAHTFLRKSIPFIYINDGERVAQCLTRRNVRHFINKLEALDTRASTWRSIERAITAPMDFLLFHGKITQHTRAELEHQARALNKDMAATRTAIRAERNAEIVRNFRSDENDKTVADARRFFRRADVIEKVNAALG